MSQLDLRSSGGATVNGIWERGLTAGEKMGLSRSLCDNILQLSILNWEWVGFSVENPPVQAKERFVF